MKIFIILPTQLYENINHLKDDKYDQIYLVEENINFVYLKYTKLKLAYHRATMKNYFDYLKKNDIDVKYLEYDYKKNFKNDEIFMLNPADHLIVERWKKLTKQYTILPNLTFLISEKEILEKKNTKYTHDTFYKYMRKKLDILMTDDNRPEGKRWSFDKENRKKMNSNVKVPQLTDTYDNKYIKEAIKYVNKNFKDNYGQLDNFIYPIDHSQSKTWLNDFIKRRFSKFGDYQDFVSKEENHDFLFHSVLTPMLNVGLLTDKQILDATNRANVSLNNKEGFIRQLIGWRQYIYTIYMNEGQEMREMNFFKAKLKIPEKVWKASTMIKPIDDIINKLYKHGYAHHIERLMWLGAFFLLLGIHPKEVNDWFMVMFIDAYDVFMIPNIFGMTQHADKGKMMTRPYFSSSNYLLKMSNYKKNDSKIDFGKNTYTWTEIWDALYYNFISKHETYLKKNYSTSRQVYHWNNKSKDEQKNLKSIASKYIKFLFD